MNGRDFLISALDLLFLLLVLFIVGFLAIRYDANKGVSENAFATTQLVPLPISSYNRRHSSGRFHAAILTRIDITLYKRENGITTLVGKYSNFESLMKERILDKSTPCVLYEKENTPLLGEAIRALAANGIPVGIADLKQDMRK